jgi:predicted outer membrane repeat protein
MGGGIRLSMGSDGTFRRTTVRGNHAEGKGGGIAVRNVVLDCGEVTVSGNHCADAPGGGVAVEVVSEGALAGIPDLWTSILREVFGVHDVRITVAGGSIARNGAGFDPSGAPLPRPQAAKGGGLYLLVGSFADAPSVELRVAAAARVIAGNTARTRGYVSKVAPGKVVPTADERCLQDLRRSEEWTEANDHSLVRGGDLRFSS